MANIVLTTSPQSIAGSDLGCILDAKEESFLYAFGAGTPTENIQWIDSGPLNYTGGFGLIWVWRGTGDAKSLDYFLAV